VKQLIKNTCQLKGVYNQAYLVAQVCLFILVIISKLNRVCVCVCVAAGEEIDIHDTLADTTSLKKLASTYLPGRLIREYIG